MDSMDCAFDSPENLLTEMICQRLAQVLILMQWKSRKLIDIGVVFTVSCFRIWTFHYYVDYVVFVVWLLIVMMNAMYCNDQNNLSQNLSNINTTSCLSVHVLFIHLWPRLIFAHSIHITSHVHHIEHHTYITHTSHIHGTHMAHTSHIHHTYITHTWHTHHTYITHTSHIHHTHMAHTSHIHDTHITHTTHTSHVHHTYITHTITYVRSIS